MKAKQGRRPKAETPTNKTGIKPVLRCKGLLRRNTGAFSCEISMRAGTQRLALPGNVRKPAEKAPPSKEAARSIQTLADSNATQGGKTAPRCAFATAGKREVFGYGSRLCKWMPSSSRISRKRARFRTFCTPRSPTVFPVPHAGGFRRAPGRRSGCCRGCRHGRAP